MGVGVGVQIGTRFRRRAAAILAFADSSREKCGVAAPDVSQRSAAHALRVKRIFRYASRSRIFLRLGDVGPYLLGRRTRTSRRSHLRVAAVGRSAASPVPQSTRTSETDRQLVSEAPSSLISFTSTLYGRSRCVFRIAHRAPIAHCRRGVASGSRTRTFS